MYTIEQRSQLTHAQTPDHLWGNKCLLFESTKLVVICYLEIENGYTSNPVHLVNSYSSLCLCCLLCEAYPDAPRNRWPLPPSLCTTPLASFHSRTVALHCHCSASSKSLGVRAIFYLMFEFSFSEIWYQFCKREEGREMKKKKGRMAGQLNVQ